MALSYTGKLFRRIAICCGAAHGNPHMVWEQNLLFKYRDEYYSYYTFVYRRSEKDNRFHIEIEGFDDDKLFEFWKALKWLEDNGFICRRKGLYKHGRSRSACYTAYYIRLTDKGLAVAPKYIKQKED